jgi:hypothetical protein
VFKGAYYFNKLLQQHQAYDDLKKIVIALKVLFNQQSNLFAAIVAWLCSAVLVLFTIGASWRKKSISLFQNPIRLMLQ